MTEIKERDNEEYGEKDIAERSRNIKKGDNKITWGEEMEDQGRR